MTKYYSDYGALDADQVNFIGPQKCLKSIKSAISRTVGSTGRAMTFDYTMSKYNTTTEELIYSEIWSVVADSMEDYPSRVADTEGSTTENTNFSVISIIGLFAVAMRKRRTSTTNIPVQK